MLTQLLLEAFELIIHEDPLKRPSSFLAFLWDPLELMELTSLYMPAAFFSQAISVLRSVFRLSRSFASEWGVSKLCRENLNLRQHMADSLKLRCQEYFIFWSIFDRTEEAVELFARPYDYVWSADQSGSICRYRRRVCHSSRRTMKMCLVGRVFRIL